MSCGGEIVCHNDVYCFSTMNNVRNYTEPWWLIPKPIFENEPLRSSRLQPGNPPMPSPREAYIAPAIPIPSMPGWIAILLRASRASLSNLVAGASPFFPPQFLTREAAREATLHVVRRDPRQYDVERSRWSLATLQQTCRWLQGITLPGVSQVLRRLRVSYKRAREYVHSPDPHYVAKLVTIHVRLQEIRRQWTPRLVLLFQDEMTYERHPSLATAYATSGREQPLAVRSQASATQRRIIATLDACTGRVIFRQAARIRIPTLCRFYEQVCAAYADEPTLIYLIQDNWPVHLHPDVLARLIPQTFAFPRPLPPNWPTTPRKTWPEDKRLPLKLVMLPTYAPWTNPIEKLWRWLRQEVLHLHRLADDWHGLQTLVTQFLEQFAQGSRALLRYVGLSDLDAVYRGAFATSGIPPPLLD